MTTDRQVTIMAASAIMRGLSIDLVDPVLRKALNNLAHAIETDAALESEKGIAATRKDIRKLRDRLVARRSLAGIIMGEALGGVVLLLIPR